MVDCGDGRGKTCPKHNSSYPSLSCCIGTQGTTCYDIDTEQCCNAGLLCYNDRGLPCACNNKFGHKCPIDKECCISADGNTVNCCDTAECETCDSNGNCVIGPTALSIIITWEEYGNCSKLKQWPGYTPTTNGCSTPTGNNPAGGACGEASSFLNACNIHDVCYGSCGKTQGECDGQFGDNLDLVCEPLSGICYASCNDWATIYASFVDLLGEGYWQNGQLESCGCCNR
jgi:hypothetical protein